MITPDFIFESSWEVCNKVGGIYTVLSSKAYTLHEKFKDNIIFLGPDFDNEPIDFKEDKALFSDWVKSLPSNLKVRIGRWQVPGEPPVMLISYKTFFDKRDSIFFEMWESFDVDSSNAHQDYNDACIFAYSVGLVIESFYNFYKLENKKVTALFNEWMLGMGLLYIKKYVPAIATIFTTHATTIGRSIAGNNKPLYGYMNSYNGDQMANELNVKVLHSLEKQAAHHADCFTTVSDITAVECKQLLEKEPDVVTPNGFEKGFVPVNAEYTKKRNEAREQLMLVTEKLTGRSVDKDALLILTSGRYEYRNKGLDVFISAMDLLRKSENLDKEIVVFIMVPAWVHEARADLKFIIEKDYNMTSPMRTPFLTHWLNNMNEDKVMNFFNSSGFTNSASEKLRIVFAPCYLDGNDGIFNKQYYDILPGMDVTVFASYYEPWGYTPLESIAFGVPTITTSLAGFGVWAKTIVSGNDIKEGVTVIERTDDNYFDVVNKVAATIKELFKKDTGTIRENCFNLAAQAEWSIFMDHYYKAFEIAMINSENRVNN
jgi:Glycosyltransferase